MPDATAPADPGRSEVAFLAAPASRSVNDPARLRVARRLAAGGEAERRIGDALARLVVRLLGVPSARLTFVLDDVQAFGGFCDLAPSKENSDSIPLRLSICQHVLDRSTPMVIPDTRLDDRFRHHGAVLESGIAAYLGFPIVTDDGQAVGALCALDYEPRHWTATEIDDLASLAELATAEVNARLRRSASWNAAGHGDAWPGGAAGADGRGAPIVCLDERLRIVLAGSGTVRLLGRDASSLAGVPLSGIVAPEDYERLATRLRDGLTPGRAFDVGRYRFAAPNGGWLDAAVVVRDLRQDPVMAATVLELHVAGDEGDADSPLTPQSARERYYLSLSRPAARVTTVLSTRGVVLAGSAAIGDVFGYELADFVGTNALDLIHPEDRSRCDTYLDRVRDAEDLFSLPPITFRYRHADGSWRWTEAAVADFVDDPVVGGFVVSSRDITRERAALDEERDAYVATLLRHGADMIAILGPDCRVRYLSPTVTTILGICPETAADQTLVAWVHPDDEPDVRSRLERLVTGDATSERFECRLADSQGQWHWLEIVATVLDDQPGLDGIVLNARDISERREMQARLTMAANRDPLTGMANRAHFMDELHRAIEAGDTEPVTVMFLDLDDFKLINDSFGHSAGDQFLVEVAGRIGATLGDHGELARFGGDEFTILLASGTEPGMAGCVAEGIIDRLRRPYVIHGHAITARASIGIASTESVPRSAESLIQAADTALYQVKANGGNAWATYTPGMSTEVRERLVIESRLHRAVAEDELRLLYQPIVDLRDGRLVGAEALVRWQHPELGEIAPDRFLPVAEVAGVIARIDQWVLRQACLQAARWRSVAPLTVSVNVARHWIRHGNLVQAVREALDETGLPAAAIRLEITEGVTAREGAAFLPQLLELRDLGVRMSVDDFGTGESSLAALRRYPVDMLKIDRAFTLGLDEAGARDARAVIRAVVGIGQALGLEVVAEGIETPAQLEAMRDLGCRFGQGFLFGRPAPANAITAMLDRPVRALPAEPVAITASAAAAAAEE